MNTAIDPVSNPIAPQHWQEWVIGSGVHPAIVAANVEFLAGHWALEALLYAAIPDHGHNRHYLTTTAAKLFDKYEHITDGGWAVSGVDPLNHWQRMQWIQFKPDHPRPDPQNPGKFIKYETPPRAESRALLLYVPDEQAELIYQRYEVNPTPEDRAIGFWHVVWKYSLPIIITEGAKKAGCLLNLGYVAIALPGITMGVRTKDGNGLSCLPYLIPDLQCFATKGREWFICFDFETKSKTIQSIRHETDKLCKLLQLAGGKAKIIQLPGPEKGVDDFVVTQGAEAFAACYQVATAYEVWQISAYTQLSYKPDLELNQRYLRDLIVPEDARFVCIKSAKGTGKTEGLVRLVEKATQTGQPILLITHRTQLGQAICDRIGLPYITEVRSHQAGSLLGYGLCVDSLHPESQARFDATHWQNAIVIIDECEQVISHLLSAKTTVSKHRMAILRQLRQLLINTLESDSGRVILLDADLSDLSIDFILKTSEARIEPWIAVNHWQPEQGWEIYHYAQTEPTEWYHSLIGGIEAGGHHFICTHSQQAKSRWSTRTMEADLSRRFPTKRILRIDSQSIADPTHPAYGCISRLNEILGNYDIVLSSPTIETGVSIDIRGHFTAVWGCFQGATPENSVRQSLARVREPVERHVWIAKHGLNKVGNGGTSPRSLLSSQKKMAQASLRLADFDFDVETGEIVSHHAALNTWAKMSARINIGMLKYRDIILHGLRQEGHQVIDFDWKVDRRELKQEITAVRDEQYREECEAKCAAVDITPKEYEALQAKKTKTPQEWHKECKHKLQQRYSIDVTPELVQKDDKGWYPQIRLYYYLMVGRSFLKERDKAIAEVAVQSNEMWLPTFNHSQLGVRIGALEYLGVPLLLNPEREFRCTDADLIELANKAKAQAWVLKQVLNLTISPKDTPIAIAQKLLGKLGQRLTYDRREGGRNEPRVRVYVYRPAKDGRDEVYVKWLEHDQLKRNQSAVSTPGTNKEIA